MKQQKFFTMNDKQYMVFGRFWSKIDSDLIKNDLAFLKNE